MELELKFSSGGAVPGLPELAAAFASLGLTLGEVRTVSIRDLYFDDPRANLTRAGLAVRRRMIDGEMLATLKTRGHVSGGLYQREEIEEPLVSAAWPEAIHDRISLITAPASLQAYTILDNERLIVPLLQDGRERVTVNFDSVSVTQQHGGTPVTFSEVELEATRPESDPAAETELLQQAAAALGQLLPLKAGTLTKLERAQALLRGETPA